MNCDIICDLLPSYVDGLTRAASNAAVEEHLARCEHCRREYEAMRDERAPVLETAGREIDCFLRVREELIRRVLIAVAVVTLALTGLYAAYQNLYLLGRSAESDTVTVSLRESEGGSVLEFTSTKENRVLRVGYTENVTCDGAEPVLTLILVEYRRDIFRAQDETMGQYPFAFSGENAFTVGYRSSWFDQSTLYYDEDDFLAIEFNDTVKTIRLADLRAGELSSLR